MIEIVRRVRDKIHLGRKGRRLYTVHIKKVQRNGKVKLGISAPKGTSIRKDEK